MSYSYMTTNEGVGYCNLFPIFGKNSSDRAGASHAVKHTRQRSLFIAIIKYSQSNILKKLVILFPLIPQQIL